MRFRFRCWLVGGSVLMGVCGACQTPPMPRIRQVPLPARVAVGIYHENVERISGTLRAVGSVDGRFSEPDGGSRSFHLDATLFFLDPNYVRLDLKKLGSRQLLFGSNDVDFWIYSQRDDDYFCGRQGQDAALPANISIRPDQLADALGLSRKTIGAANESSVRVHRIVDDYQQILFMGLGEDGQPFIEREVWLDRYTPNLAGRIIFRDDEGQVELESVLTSYRELSPGGPWLPMSISLSWPKSDSHMRLRVAKWKLFEQVKSDSVQFRTPKECAGQFSTK